MDLNEFITMFSTIGQSPIWLFAIGLLATFSLWWACKATYRHLARERNWYQQRCKVLANRHKLNMGQENILRHLPRNQSNRAVRLRRF